MVADHWDTCTDCASKWAVEGFTEAVALEVKPEWGIKFTCVEPGGEPSAIDLPISSLLT